jgi:hypothetical protein
MILYYRKALLKVKTVKVGNKEFLLLRFFMVFLCFNGSYLVILSAYVFF